ncbi:MAG: hypothetical protein OWT28_07750 [Firmicutes bacterium]|nr:hypothetical protein [Bacillota bacterium]
MFKVVLPGTTNVIDAISYSSQSRLTSKAWYIMVKTDNETTLKYVSGMWMIGNSLIRFVQRKKITKLDMTFNDLVLKAYGNIIKNMPLTNGNYLLYVDNYGIEVYDKFRKCDTLILPLFASQGHLDIYMLPVGSLSKLNLEFEEGEINIYNHQLHGKIKYITARQGTIVKVEDNIVITSEDHPDTIELQQGDYLLVHTPPAKKKVD